MEQYLSSMIERLYLYALVRPDGQWGYIGATSQLKRRVHCWEQLRPKEHFKILMVGDEVYVLAMERKLIRYCWKRGIPIRNKQATNTPVAVLRAAGRKAGRITGPQNVKIMNAKLTREQRSRAGCAALAARQSKQRRRLDYFRARICGRKEWRLTSDVSRNLAAMLVVRRPLPL
jgi:hypothetical protein